MSPALTDAPEPGERLHPGRYTPRGQERIWELVVAMAPSFGYDPERLVKLAVNIEEAYYAATAAG